MVHKQMRSIFWHVPVMVQSEEKDAATVTLASRARTTWNTANGQRAGGVGGVTGVLAGVNPENVEGDVDDLGFVDIPRVQSDWLCIRLR
jgi:hypothetical protein